MNFGASGESGIEQYGCLNTEQKLSGGNEMEEESRDLTKERNQGVHEEAGSEENENQQLDGMKYECTKCSLISED